MCTRGIRRLYPAQGKRIPELGRRDLRGGVSPDVVSNDIPSLKMSKCIYLHKLAMTVHENRKENGEGSLDVDDSG